jgi:hypothetical protein
VVLVRSKKTVTTPLENTTWYGTAYRRLMDVAVPNMTISIFLPRWPIRVSVLAMDERAQGDFADALYSPPLPRPPRGVEPIKCIEIISAVPREPQCQHCATATAACAESDHSCQTRRVTSLIDSASCPVNLSSHPGCPKPRPQGDIFSDGERNPPYLSEDTVVPAKVERRMSSNATIKAIESSTVRLPLMQRTNVPSH